MIIICRYQKNKSFSYKKLFCLTKVFFTFIRREKIKKAFTIFVTFLLVVLYIVLSFIYYYHQRYTAQKLFSQTSEIFNEVKNTVIKEERKSLEKNKQNEKENKNKIAKLSIDKLKEKNEDIVSFIKIDGTQIEYPIVYKDNDFYLRHDLNKKYNIAGTLFMEEENNKDYSDKNTIIYGHNLQNVIGGLSPMFSEIVNFTDYDYVKDRKNNIIEIYTPKGFKKYKIFSVYYSTAYDDYTLTNRENEKWIPYLKKLENKSVVNFTNNYIFKSDSKIITLSTCDNVTEEGRIVLHGILIQDKN